MGFAIIPLLVLLMISRVGQPVQVTGMGSHGCGCGLGFSHQPETHTGGAGCVGWHGVFFFFTTNSRVVLTPPLAMAPLVCKLATSHLSHLLSSRSSIIMASFATACHTAISLKFSLAVSAGSHCLIIESSPCPTPLPVLAFWARVCHCSRPPIINLFLDPGFSVQRALCDSDIIPIPL